MPTEHSNGNDSANTTESRSANNTEITRTVRLPTSLDDDLNTIVTNRNKNRTHPRITRSHLLREGAELVVAQNIDHLSSPRGLTKAIKTSLESIDSKLQNLIEQLPMLDNADTTVMTTQLLQSLQIYSLLLIQINAELSAQMLPRLTQGASSQSADDIIDAALEKVWHSDSLQRKIQQLATKG